MWMKRGGGGSGKEDAEEERIAECQMTELLIIAETIFSLYNIALHVLSVLI